MLEYDPKMVGPKVEEIYEDIKKMLDLFVMPDQKQYLINYVQSKILDCMVKKDIITALAISNCAVGSTEVSAEDFNFGFIEDIAVQNDYADFAVSFLGCCRAMHYLDQNN